MIRLTAGGLLLQLAGNVQQVKLIKQDIEIVFISESAYSGDILCRRISFVGENARIETM